MKPVDLLASEKIRRELQVLMPAFQALEANDRQKAYVTVAWSFVRSGDVEEALKLVDLLTPEYVRDVLSAQMDADHTFDKIAEVVANAIVDAQVYVPSYLPLPNCPVVRVSGLA